MAQVIDAFGGWETGDASDIASLGASSTIQSSIVKSGGYALLGAGNMNRLVAGKTYGQFVFAFGMFAGGYPGSGFTNTFTETPASGTNRLLLDVMAVSGLLRLRDNGATLGLANTSGTTALPLNVWNTIDIAFDPAAGGVVKLWLNGVLEISTTHSTDVSAAPTDRINWVGRASPNGWYMDDWAIASGGLTPIGVTRTVARQGIAGTPTYNTGTKVGGTTGANCMSDTPFDTTNYITQATNGNFQTMNVAPFSTDPGRTVEGTQAISANATIIGAKVVMVGKSSASTGTARNLSIRRRSASVDTDTALSGTTVPTVDGGLQSEVFTDTLAHLDAYEIGYGKTGATASTITCRDMWLMVCYIPAAYAFALGAGAFALSGQALTQKFSYALKLGTGVFALMGQPILVHQEKFYFHPDPNPRKPGRKLRQDRDAAPALTNLRKGRG